MTNGTTAQSNAAAHVQHLRKRIMELEAEKRALYTAPPRPDASAGLIEAADQIQRLQRCLAFFASAIKSGEPWTATCEREYRDALRARAADTSEK
jgi:hypothetical protein